MADAIGNRNFGTLRVILPEILEVMEWYGHTDTGLNAMILVQDQSTLNDGLEQELQISRLTRSQRLRSSEEEEEDLARIIAKYMNPDAFIVRLRYPASFVAVGFWPIELFTVRPSPKRKHEAFSRSAWTRALAIRATKLLIHARNNKSRDENCFIPQDNSEFKLDVLQHMRGQARVPMVTYVGNKEVGSVLEEAEEPPAEEPPAEEEYRHEDAEPILSAKEDDNHHRFSHTLWMQPLTVSLWVCVVTAWLRIFGLRFLTLISALLQLNCLRS